mmetsp:Transcript_28081/g.81174  ORF Transcript_28081/g.81174 Transcript_28081/m.81174 type:complete len:572 (-) Transcript_28081:39-1754(-)
MPKQNRKQTHNSGRIGILLEIEEAGGPLGWTEEQRLANERHAMDSHLQATDVPAASLDEDGGEGDTNYSRPRGLKRNSSVVLIKCSPEEYGRGNAGSRVEDLCRTDALNVVLSSKAGEDQPLEEFPAVTTAKTESDNDNSETDGVDQQRQTISLDDINRIMDAGRAEASGSRPDGDSTSHNSHGDGDSNGRRSDSSSSSSSDDSGAVSDQGEAEQSSDQGTGDQVEEGNNAIPRFIQGTARASEYARNRVAEAQAQAPAQPPQPAQKLTPRELFCDICGFPPTHRQLRHQTCCRCRVLVHETCYGIEPFNGSSWECHGCRAVGTAIRGRSSQGVIESMEQYYRPRQCQLCPISSGAHAMHPLYDRDGPNGRQIILPSADGMPRRLAWVHSLCAFFINSFETTSGCVYACDNNGKYVDEDGTFDGEDETVFVAHHFVICGPEYSDHHDIIRSLQTAYKTDELCLDCKLPLGGSRRIPVECSTGNKDEHKSYMKLHRSKGYLHRHTNPEYNCHRRMHVGCARWGGGQGDGRECAIIFTPGPADGMNESGVVGRSLICECYCPYHYSEIKDAIM